MTPQNVLDFWLGPLDAEGMASASHSQRWWRKDPELDAEIRTRFFDTWQTISTGAHADWLEEAYSRLAYVIVLDQFSRNMFRDSAQAFAGDARALKAADEGVARGHDRQLSGQARVFLYMPFMHSESLAMQQRCLTLFRSFADESSGKLRETLMSNIGFAQRHLDIIERFGRFPHRNQVLGRSSTPAELEFLQKPGSSF